MLTESIRELGYFSQHPERLASDKAHKSEEPVSFVNEWVSLVEGDDSDRDNRPN